MIDTHAHIYSEKFSEDREAMLQRAFESGVSEIFMPNIDSKSIEGMLALEEKYPGKCHAMMGLHPCSVDEHFEQELKIAEEWWNKRTFAGVGEMGLDLYWDKTFFEQQQEAFRIQAGWAKKFEKPLIIHTRDAMAETIALLEELQHEKLTGVVHCFTGNLDDANRIIDTGFMLGIGGVATFKNGGLDKVLPHLDLTHLVLETDSPYLSPKPYRGKRNEPSYVVHVAHRVAALTGNTVEEVEKKTNSNAKRLFQMDEAAK